MTPLDLTQHPPRSSRAELAGIAFLPRAIDKVRSDLPGGNLGSYVIVRDDIVTMSALFYRRMGVTPDEFAAAVRDARTEEDVAVWLRARVDDAKIEKWHAQLFALRLGDVPSPAREQVLARHPGAADMPDSTLLIDVFEADDAASYTPPATAYSSPSK